MESSNGFHRLSLPGMPTELLSLIVNLVDSQSLKALRLTNKHLCAISSGPLAKRHFSERRHVASAYSMEALVEIAAHPFFGQFVKTVIISGSRPKIRENPFLRGVPRSCVQCPRHSSLCKNPAPHHLAMDFKQLRIKLEEAFSNIRHHSPSVFIGVCDSAFRCYGSVYYHADCSMVSTQRDFPSSHYSRRDECNQFVKTFDEVYRAARRSKCKIDGVKLDIFSICIPFMARSHHGSEVRDLLRYVLGYLPGAWSFELSLEMCHSSEPRYYLRYDCKKGKLDLAGLNLDSTTYLEDLGPAVESLLSRLSTCALTCVKLSDCSFGKSDLSWFYGQTLKGLTLHNVSFYTEYFDTNLWSTVLSHLAQKTHLRYLEISQCCYRFANGENVVDDYHGYKPWFHLPSGFYELKGELRWEFNFYLAPSGDSNEAIVLSDQTSISAQLKSLADQVAQMELDKITEIERDGYVRTDIVGISKKPESDKGIASGESDHDNMEDNGSDEAGGDGDEREENKDQDEHEFAVESSAT